MLDKLIDLLLDRRLALTLLFGVLLLALVCLPFAARVERDDDLLAFLPAQDPDVVAFREVADRFGGLDVTLVGIRTEDAYDGAFLERLRALTADIEDIAGVDLALSLASVDDFRQSPDGGIVSALLVETVPADGPASAALRARVEAMPWVHGALVAEDGRGALLLAFHGLGADTRTGAHDIAEAATRAFGDDAFVGGAPAIAGWIHAATERDLARLTPWALLLIVAIAVASFRDLWGTLLPLGCTSLGLLATWSTMGWAGEPFTLVLAALPVILFALGTAYPVHILAAYYGELGHGRPPHEALRVALRAVGPSVLLSGLTTMVGLGSCLMMNIRPMRMFGLFTAIGIGVTLALSLTLIPALIGLVRMRGTAPSAGDARSLTARYAALGRRSPVLAGAVWAALTVVAVASATQVDARVDLRSFLVPGSPPDRASDFLDHAFGGTQVVQVELTGDLGHPAVLRHVAATADALAALPGVTRVDSVTDVLARANEAFTNARRLPDSPAQVATLYGFLAGRRSVAALVTDQRDATLLHARIGSDNPEVLDAAVVGARAVAAAAAGRFASDRGPARDFVVGRIAKLTDKDTAVVRAALAASPVAAPAEMHARQLALWLASDECFVPLTQRVAEAVATAWAAGARDGQAIAEVLPDDVSADDVQVAIDGVWADLVRRADAETWAGALASTLGGDVAAIAGAVRDLDAELLRRDATGTVEVNARVTGTPAVYGALSRAVSSNLRASLGGALAVCALLNLLLFRSLGLALAATLPTAFCTAVTYGLMAAIGVRLDVGTSMLGAIAVGAGVDFSIHLLWALRSDPVHGLARALQDRAPGIWVNAWMVSGGFLVLTLGESRPLQNVGSLTAVAILSSAVATFGIVPWLTGLRAGTGRGAEGT